MMDVYVAGVVAAVAMIFLLLKLDLQKVAGYDLPIDIAFTSGLAYLLGGTYSGMMAALLGGAIVSVFLWLTRQQVGAKRLTWKGWTRV